MKNAPCVNCSKKGCGSYHEQCELYLAFKQERQVAQRNKLKKAQEGDYIYHAVQRTKKKGKRNGK